MLFDAVFQIDDHIILEQKKSIHGTEGLYHEHKKAPDSGTLQFDDKSEDARFQYPDLSTGHASSYQLRLTSMELMKHDILLEVQLRSICVFHIQPICFFESQPVILHIW